MRKYRKLGLALIFSMFITIQVYPLTDLGMTEADYIQAETRGIYEEIGLITENHPDLGYLVYVNDKGQKLTRNYYKNQVKVKKKSHFEVEDMIGYIGEIFPAFEFNPRDTTAEKLQPGDYIYMHIGKDGYISSISASTDHIVRYGKVKQFTPGGMEASKIVIEDEQGQIFHLDIQNHVPVTKRGIPITTSQIQEGDWVKILISQGIIAPGNVSQYVREVVVDGGSRNISNIYKGQVTYIDPYQNNIHLKNTQPIQANGWGAYTDIKPLAVNPNGVESYHLGNRVSWDYVNRYLKHQPGYAYIAMENYYGSERAVKLDFQSLHQRTIPANTIISSQPGKIKLMSGETVFVSADAIIRRNGRLVDPHSIMPGDYAQVVVTGENKAAVVDISQKPSKGSLEIFRGRIKQIKDRENFEVETFSMLDEVLWMYHPNPRTFRIDANTKFYDESGIVAGGLEDFKGYGDTTQIDEVFTTIIEGDYAKAVIKMPYTRYSLRGQIYESAADGIKIKDTYIYHTERKRWEVKGRKDNTQNIDIQENVQIIKNGEIISPGSLAAGDNVRIFTSEENIKDSSVVPGYLIIVE